MSEAQVVTPLLWGSILRMAVAQFLKPFLDAVLRRGFQWRRAFDSGGMPSSHTSLVTTLTLGVAATEGTGSTIFAVTLAFSLYFVFEATGPEIVSMVLEYGHLVEVITPGWLRFDVAHRLAEGAKRYGFEVVKPSRAQAGRAPGAPVQGVRRVAVRKLRQGLAAVLGAVQDGATYEVTSHGEVVARMVPPS